MNPSQRRAPRSRDLRLALTALLAFMSWGGLLAFFTVIPVLYLRQTAGHDLQALKASWSLSAPIIIGGACAVVILFLLYYLMASNLRCQVCGGLVFGGGETHRKHPNAKKFLGLSYSRRVAWEILTSSGFHCMHCQTLCRNRRRGAADDPLVPGSQSGAVPPVFQVSPTGGEGAFSTQFFNTLFAGTAAEASVPPPPKPSFSGQPSSVQPEPPAGPRPVPTGSPFTLVGTQLGAHPPTPELPLPAAKSSFPAMPEGIRALIPPQPRTVPAAPSLAGNSPFTLFTPPGTTPAEPIPANSNPAQPMSTPFTFPPPPVAAPVKPMPQPAASPSSAQTPVTAPASPTPAQVVAQVTELMEKTRASLDEMFGKMLGELRKVLEKSKVAAAEVPDASPRKASQPPAEMVNKAPAMQAPLPMSMPPMQAPAQPAPAPAPAGITLPSLPGLTPQKPFPAAPPAAAPAPAVAPAPAQAAEMNAVLARAFAQSQRQADPAAPLSKEGINGAEGRIVHPQSPFSLVANQEEPARPAAAVPSMSPPAPAPAQPPNVLPLFPPFPQPASQPPSVGAPAASLPLPPMAPPTAAQSPFAVVHQPVAHAPQAPISHTPTFTSPFAGLPELAQNQAVPPPMPPPFTFLSQQGDQFVADPNKLPPQWPAASLPAVANQVPPNPQALQFSQMQAQQLAQFQAQQLAQLQAQQLGQPQPPTPQEGAPMPPPFAPQWPMPNGQPQ